MTLTNTKRNLCNAMATMTRMLHIVSVLSSLSLAAAFSPATQSLRFSVSHPFEEQQASTRKATTSLYAIGALAKKAKEASLREYAEAGVEEHVMKEYKAMKAAMESAPDDLPSFVGPVQESLTKRKGTITVIAEYRRKTSFGEVHETHVPELLSPIFREFGASAISVLADERMGGCTYNDVAEFVEEQRRARNEVPGPVPILNSDLIVDELQVARSKAYGCAGLVISLGIVGEEQTKLLLKATRAADMEAIVSVTSKAEAQAAIDMGASMVSVTGLENIEELVAAVDGLDIPDGRQVCTIANVVAKMDQQLQEIEDAWAIRDRGFNAVWVGEPLYKGGSDPNEQPAGIIKSMQSKSSLKFASPKAATGRGEGAREYLGDIMM